MDTLNKSIKTGIAQLIAIWFSYGWWSWSGGLPPFKALFIATVIVGFFMAIVHAISEWAGNVSAEDHE